MKGSVVCPVGSGQAWWASTLYFAYPPESTRLMARNLAVTPERSAVREALATEWQEALTSVVVAVPVVHIQNDDYAHDDDDGSNAESPN